MTGFILRILELEALRLVCTPIYWTWHDGVLVMETMEPREMEEAG